jgi:hypothetical protein
LHFADTDPLAIALPTAAVPVITKVPPDVLAEPPPPPQADRNITRHKVWPIFRRLFIFVLGRVMQVSRSYLYIINKKSPLFVTEAFLVEVELLNQVWGLEGCW